MLEKIKEPSDLKALNHEEQEILCQEIRDRIISVTSQNGGHVGPNLGVVELTIALHLAFNSPEDSFLWDVSHQGYVHKLLTGRNDDAFDKLIYPRDTVVLFQGKKVIMTLSVRVMRNRTLQHSACVRPAI